MAQGIIRSVTHWTAGAGTASSLDLKHYHKVTQQDATVVDGKEAIEDNIVTSDGDYAAHTLRLNTGSIGVAMAGMHGAKESPFDPGPYPINERQFEAHCRLLAQLHVEYGILPITDRNCLTHAEVEGTLGVKQRGKWDITRLVFKPDLRGARAVGDYMRERVNSYLGAIPQPVEMNRPILRQGDRGAMVMDMQVLLKATRFFVGAADGIFGSRTKTGVMAFQDHAGLMVDGVVGAQTWRALMDADPQPERDVTEDDLRDRGSDTVHTADKGETESKTAATLLSAGGAVEIATSVGEVTDQAGGFLPQVQTLLVDNWLAVAVLITAALIYWRGPKIMQAIRDLRTKDARTGAHLGK